MARDNDSVSDQIDDQTIQLRARIAPKTPVLPCWRVLQARLMDECNLRNPHNFFYFSYSEVNVGQACQLKLSNRLQQEVKERLNGQWLNRIQDFVHQWLQASGLRRRSRRMGVITLNRFDNASLLVNP